MDMPPLPLCSRVVRPVRTGLDTSGGADLSSLLIDGPGTGIVPDPSCSSGTGGTEQRR